MRAYCNELALLDSNNIQLLLLIKYQKILHLVCCLYWTKYMNKIFSMSFLKRKSLRENFLPRKSCLSDDKLHTVTYIQTYDCFKWISSIHITTTGGISACGHCVFFKRHHETVISIHCIALEIGKTLWTLNQAQSGICQSPSKPCYMICYQIKAKKFYPPVPWKQWRIVGVGKNNNIKQKYL